MYLCFLLSCSLSFLVSFFLGLCFPPSISLFSSPLISSWFGVLRRLSKKTVPVNQSLDLVVSGACSNQLLNKYWSIQIWLWNGAVTRPKAARYLFWLVFYIFSLRVCLCASLCVSVDVCGDWVLLFSLEGLSWFFFSSPWVGCPVFQLSKWHFVSHRCSIL